MIKQASLQWNRLRRYLLADPGRFAGGSAVSDPLGLLAIERERLAAPRWPRDAARPCVTRRAAHLVDRRFNHAARTRVRARVFPGGGRPPA
jgi:hypothetical protein